MKYHDILKLHEVEKSLQQVIADCRSLNVPRHQLDEMQSLTSAGEPGVALENLCTQLYEYDVVVPLAVYNRIAMLGNAMTLDAARWEILARGITDD